MTLDFDTLLKRLDQTSADPCADARHAGAMRDVGVALRALNDVSTHIMAALTYPHEPTKCANPEHVQLLREAAGTLELAMTMVPDGLRYLAATTPDATQAVRTKRMRKLSDVMAEQWRRSQPS